MPVVAALFWGSLVLLAAEIVQPNLPAGWRGHWPWHAVLPGVPATIALLTATMIGIVVGERWFAEHQPALRCRSRPVIRTEQILGEQSEVYWQASVTNAGDTPAVIDAVTWRVEDADGERDEVASLALLQQLLAKYDLLDAEAYSFAAFSRGAVVGKGETIVYFESVSRFLATIRALDATFVYRSLAGGCLERTLPLLPQPDASRAPRRPG
jgi:hypothetical protein